MPVIYLDNNATTKPHPDVLSALLPFYTELWGNPSSIHHFGSQVTKHVDHARDQVARLIGAQKSNEIIFTSGGTEANNLAIRGALQANPKKRHIITTQVEHSSVSSLCHELEKENFKITYLPVQSSGALHLEDLKKAIRSDTALVSIMWANNETGVLFPVEEIAKICEENKIPFHSDAIQAVGKIPVDLQKARVSLLTLAGHKLHAPKGVGALYVRRGTQIKAQLVGGSQERSRRAGTENVAGIIGLGKACELSQKRLAQNGCQTSELRNSFETHLKDKFGFVQINGKEGPRLPNTSSITFEGLDAETICLLLNEEAIAVSTGSACSAGSLDPSHVLKAMGFSQKRSKGTVRFSLSFETTNEEINQTITVLEKVLRRLKK
ncbi:MAG: cysteine desulfurase NifS [Deltaproteobacteria bacterium]|nr:cysteine desulfurase NifS [Deltaproteobacteria bacterium]